MKREDALALLSDREFEILRLLALGHSIRDIAEKLCLTYKTIANYQSSIRQKLGADTSVQLIRIATEHGLLASNGLASG
jgi:DNA-binding NarL/FixJ family response regulator